MARGGVLQRILDPHHHRPLVPTRAAAQRQYTNELLFSSLVDLMTRVVIRPRAVRPRRLPQTGRSTPGQRSIRLQQTPARFSKLAVSAALVRVIPPDASHPSSAPCGPPLPLLLPGYRVKFLDGNHLAATEHRLEELRSTWAAPLPGLALAVLDQEYGTVTERVAVRGRATLRNAALLGRSIPWSARAGVGWRISQLLHFGSCSGGYLGPRAASSSCASTLAASRVSCWANWQRSEGPL